MPASALRFYVMVPAAPSALTDAHGRAYGAPDPHPAMGNSA